jgi:asparagine synthase (glutamine-hydrolysing)
MPGIAGIIRKSPYDGIERDLSFMVEAMRHEAFYHGGQYINKDSGLYLGWMGHQGEFCDCMPLFNPTRDVLMIFHGQNYLDETVRAKMRAGSKVNGSNASYLIDLYTELGDEFFRCLNGWYSGVIADFRKRTITLFNDRYGMGRLYVYEGDNEILFASEAKSLLKVRPHIRAIDPEALAQFLRCDCVLGNKSLFKNISLLPGGSSWSFNGNAQVKKGRYFDAKEWEQQETLPFHELYQQFAATVSRIVPLYAQDAGKVALSLTAGLDTRAIMASLHLRDRSFPCYTFGGTWSETYDIVTARKLANIYNQPYKVIRIDGEFFNNFAELAQKSVYLSDGTHEAFGAHDVYFNQIARDIAPIRLTGKFGSEVVRVRRGIPFFEFPKEVATLDFKPFLQSVPSPSQVIRAQHPLSRTVFEEIPACEFGGVAVEQSQVTLRTPYLDNQLVKLMFQASAADRAEGQLQVQYVRDQSPQLAAILTNLTRSGHSNRLVRELRYLFFWSLFKVEYIYLFATPHWLTWLDRRLENLQPERFFAGRQKFEGYRIWIRTKLSDFIRQTLSDPGAEFTRFFERKTVERMVARHIAGTHNYLDAINKVLTVELICAKLLKP